MIFACIRGLPRYIEAGPGVVRVNGIICAGNREQPMDGHGSNEAYRAISVTRCSPTIGAEIGTATRKEVTVVDETWTLVGVTKSPSTTRLPPPTPIGG